MRAPGKWRKMTTRIHTILSLPRSLAFVAQSTIIQIQKMDASRPMSPQPPNNKDMDLSRDERRIPAADT